MFLIDLFKYIFLGLLQGFTEPIPVSSSGHLVIFKSLFNLNITDLNFEIIVNFGSLIAIIIFFFKDIVAIIKDFILYIKSKDKKYYKNFKYFILIVIGTIPAGILGLIFKDEIESILSTTKVVGVTLLITALFLFIIRNFKGQKTDSEITYKDALIIGLFQAIALFPGISRSGATLVGGMFCKLKREEAFKFSFMLYIPISIATMLLGVSDLVNNNISLNTWMLYLVGMIFSAIATFFATKWFHKIVKDGKLIYFVSYCLIVGLLVIIFL